MSGSLSFFDCFVSLGKRSGKDPAAPWTTAYVLAEMRRCGVHAALCISNVAREYDPEFGNRLLGDEVAASDRLHPCWVVLPHHTGEMTTPRRLLRNLEAAGVRAVKVFPKSHRLSLSPVFTGELFAALEAESVLTLVDFDELPGWEALDEWLGRYPRLPVLLQRVVWGNERSLWPLLGRHENLHVEFSSFQANGALERVCKEFGPERALFGSEAPVKAMGAAKAFVEYAELSDDQRRKVAGENLCRLLRVAAPRPYRERPLPDAVQTAAEEGRPLADALVIDAHAHVCHEGAQGVGYLPMPDSDVHHLVHKNALLGVDRVCLAAWLGIYVPADERGNDVTAAAVAAYPDHVVGYATVDPSHRDDLMPEIERCYFQLGLRGMKPYIKANLPYDDERYTPWWEFGNEHRLFALIHGNQPAAVKLSAEYPEVSFLLAHRAGSWAAAREAVELINDRDNVYAEITYTTVPAGILEYLVEQCGADKVIFGTDQPMRDPRPQFGWVAYASLAEEDKQKILGLNMQRLLERVRLPSRMTSG